MIKNIAIGVGSTLGAAAIIALFSMFVTLAELKRDFSHYQDQVVMHQIDSEETLGALLAALNIRVDRIAPHALETRERLVALETRVRMHHP